MNKVTLPITLLFLFTLSASNVFAEGWCDIQPGAYQVVTHGAKDNTVYLLGQLAAQSSSIWITLSDGATGKDTVALALAAQMTGKALSIYLDDAADTCATFPSWAPFGRIRHVRILP